MTHNDISKYDQLYVHCHARKVSVNHIYGCHLIYSQVGEQFIRSLDWFNGKLAGPPHISTGNPWFPVIFPVTHGFPGRKLDISMAVSWAARGARGATARQRRSSFSRTQDMACQGAGKTSNRNFMVILGDFNGF